MLIVSQYHNIGLSLQDELQTLGISSLELVSGDTTETHERTQQSNFPIGNTLLTAESEATNDNEIESKSLKDEQHASLDDLRDSPQRGRSERSLSSTSDSKPDVVKCTRHKTDKTDPRRSSSALRNNYSSVSGPDNQDAGSEHRESDSRKRWHSEGDQLDLADQEDTCVTVKVNIFMTSSCKILQLITNLKYSFLTCCILITG